MKKSTIKNIIKEYYKVKNLKEDNVIVKSKGGSEILDSTEDADTINSLKNDSNVQSMKTTSGKKLKEAPEVGDKYINFPIANRKIFNKQFKNATGDLPINEDYENLIAEFLEILSDKYNVFDLERVASQAVINVINYAKRSLMEAKKRNSNLRPYVSRVSFDGINDKAEDLYNIVKNSPDALVFANGKYYAINATEIKRSLGGKIPKYIDAFEEDGNSVRLLISDIEFISNVRSSTTAVDEAKDDDNEFEDKYEKEQSVKKKEINKDTKLKDKAPSASDIKSSGKKETAKKSGLLKLQQRRDEIQDKLKNDKKMSMDTRKKLTAELNKIREKLKVTLEETKVRSLIRKIK